MVMQNNSSAIVAVPLDTPCAYQTNVQAKLQYRPTSLLLIHKAYVVNFLLTNMPVVSTLLTRL
jgi:hypothetical protein